MKKNKNLLLILTIVGTVFFSNVSLACTKECDTVENACSRVYCHDCPKCQNNSGSNIWMNAYSGGNTGTNTTTNYFSYGRTDDTESVTPPLAPQTSASSAETASASTTSSQDDRENLKGEHAGDKDSEHDCSLNAMRQKYLPDNGMNLESCWYCKVVTMMTNAFLSAAVNALSVCVELGLLILKLGFAIWLAYYILQQVSSIAPIKMGEMLETILVMGFKVALAGLVINYAQETLASLIVNPIMLTGIDYGKQILNGVLSAGGG